ncbi:hypothetical protein BSKO_11078 [Bryopsis sp. KO-2023]|nr:hypothetical protein BSKO_11078 [Bryopsis sp. KO-2023]
MASIVTGTGRCLGRLAQSLSFRELVPAALFRQDFSLRNLSSETESTGAEAGASPHAQTVPNLEQEKAGEANLGSVEADVAQLPETAVPAGGSGGVAPDPNVGGLSALGTNPAGGEEGMKAEEPTLADPSNPAPEGQEVKPVVAVPLTPKAPPPPEYEGESLVMREIRLHNSSMWGLKGQIISGEIIAVGRDYVVVDLGFKSLSRFFKKELSTTQIYATTKEHKIKRRQGVFFVGDRLQFRIDEVESPYGDMSLTTHKLHDTIQKDLVWKDLVEAFEHNIPIQGRVLNTVDRGYAVGVGGFVCFCPLNLIQPSSANKIGVLQMFKIAKMAGVGERRSMLVMEWRKDARPTLMKRNRMSNFGGSGGNSWV